MLPRKLLRPSKNAIFQTKWWRFLAISSEHSPILKTRRGFAIFHFTGNQDVVSSYGALVFEGPGAFNTQTFSLSPLYVFFFVKFGRSLHPNFLICPFTKLFSLNKNTKTNFSFGLWLSLHLFFLLIFC